jgi:MraZ protein
MDAKGRFLLPAAFKKQLSEEDSTHFVINRGIEECLTLFPVKIWEPIFSTLGKLNGFDPEVRDFQRNFLNGATQLELDSAGRLLIPRSLIEYAGLVKDVVLAPLIDRIEIWDKNKHKKLFESSSREVYSKLAVEVMVKKAEKYFLNN